MPTPPRSGFYRARDARREGAAGRVAGALVALVLAIPGAGCGVSLPLASLVPEPGDVLTTGSLPRARSLGLLPQSEDWRRASAALATALDPQGNGARVSWDNPESGAAGSIAAADAPYLEGDLVCRRFAAVTRLGQSEESYAGHACRNGPGDWRIRSSEREAGS